MKKFKISFIISFLLMFVFLLVSCGGTNNGSNTTTNPLAPTIDTNSNIPVTTTTQNVPVTTTTQNVPSTSGTTNHPRTTTSSINPSETDNYIELIESARTIKIVLLEGSATVTDEFETSDCFKGMNLYDGDKLVVNENSLLVIRFDEDKYVYLGENTTISVKSQGENKYKTNVFVEKGKVLAEVRNQLGQDEEFFLSSNNSVMAVRGTVFGISVNKVGEEIIQTYSVYKGVTELYVFDSKEGNLISGKLSDIQNSKFEITIPESDVLDNNETYNDMLDNWLEDVDNDYESSEGANEELDEVQITVGVPSEDDYQEIIDTINENDGGNKVTYSNIVYDALGYYGEYDGLAHSITINVETDNANILYKTTEDGEYTSEKPEFTNPGYYRTYYKITCDGYFDKEDYGVVQISKADLGINYKDNITASGLVAGMDLSYALNNIDLSNFIEVKGAESDSGELSKVSYQGEGKLELGTATYELDVIIPESLNDFYNPVKAEISLTSYEIKLENTTAIHNGILDIDEISTFNKYNGVLEEELFDYAEFSVGNSELLYDSVTFNYDYKTLGYYELKNGKNTVEVTIECEDYEINTEVYFTYNDYRTTSELSIVVDDILVSTLGEDSYYYNTANKQSINGKYRISTEELAIAFGVSTFDGYINLPTDILDENSSNYIVNQNNMLEFQDDAVSEIEFLVFPNSDSLGVRKIISVYFSQTPPSNYPTYRLKNSLIYYPGTNFDFVISESPVEYSLDGITYQAELSVDDLGEVDIYFRVGSSIIVKGIAKVLITTGGIATDALSMIPEEGINLLSNDGRTLSYAYNAGGEANTEYFELTSSDGSTISPAVDTYNIYTNIIKNAKYYNNLTHEEMTVEVTVSPMQNGLPDFDYEVTCEGYVPLTGSVHFTYPYESKIINETGPKPEPDMYDTSEVYYMHLSVVNPSDRTVSLSDVERVYASRIIYTLEDMDSNYNVLYSIDDCSTWTSEQPVFNTVGTYKVYIIYTTTVESMTIVEPEQPAISTSYDLTIIAVQNITITE